MKFLFSAKVLVFSAAVAISGWTLSVNPVNTRNCDTEVVEQVELEKVERLEGTSKPSAPKTSSTCGVGPYRACPGDEGDIWWH